MKNPWPARIVVIVIILAVAFLLAINVDASVGIPSTSSITSPLATALLTAPATALIIATIEAAPQTPVATPTFELIARATVKPAQPIQPAALDRFIYLPAITGPMHIMSTCDSEHPELCQ